MTDASLLDRAARDTARLALDSNIIVEAGAGTGKTTLMIDRICFWLLGRRDSSMKELVSLTFTEKAAAEIKIRLLGRLQNVVSILDGNSGPDARTVEFIAELKSRFGRKDSEIKAAAEEAVSLVDRAQIGTIHSFASHILKLFPLEAGLDPSCDVDDGSGFDAVFEAEWSAWLESELGESATRPEEWKEVLRHADIESLEQMARSLCGARLMDYNPGAGSEWAASLFSARAAEALRLSSEHLAPGTKPRKLEKELVKAAAALRACAEFLISGTSSGVPEPVDVNVSAVKAWDDYPDDFSRARAILSMAASSSSESHMFVRRCHAILRPFCEAMRREFLLSGSLSFDDLLVRARNLLRSSHAVRRDLKSRYKALFIDEFQDTDPLQGEIILYLAEADRSSASRWQDIKLGKGKLFVVGDPKQSIYRFRGADIEAYDSFKKLMLDQGAELCYLQVNFRSSAGIIATVNSALSALMKPEHSVQPDYVPIFPAARDSAGKDVSVWLCEEPESKAGADALRAVQAEFTARWIKDRTEGGARPALKYKDIALLFRSITPLGIYLDAFKRHGIPYVVEEDRYFYGTQEITDLMNFLKAAGDPDDSLSVAGLLRSPLCGITDAEFYRTVTSFGLDFRSAPPDAAHERVKNLYAALAEFHALAGRTATVDLTELFFKKCRVPELFAAAYHGEQTVSNLYKFCSVAAGDGKNPPAGLHEFIARAQRYIDGTRGEGESPLADDLLDAVNITTIHKAKGLEFPVVILPNINAQIGGNVKPSFAQSWASGTAGFNVGGLSDFQFSALLDAEAPHSAAEEIRILYVAMTRAKNRLLVIGNSGKRWKGSIAERLACAGLVENFVPESWPGAERGIIPFADPAGFSAGQGGSGGQSVTEDEASGWKLAWAEREKSYAAVFDGPVFATASKEEEKELFPGPVDEDAEFQHARSEAKKLGRFCHKILENHDFARPFTRKEIAAAEKFFRFYEPGENWTVTGETAASMLASLSGSAAFAELNGSRILGREMPFAFVRGDGRPVRGIMDLVAEKDGQVLVFDYKTDNTDGDCAGRAARYRPQRDLYAAAAQRLFNPERGVRFFFVFLRDGRAVEI